MRSPLDPTCPDFELELWKYGTRILMHKSEFSDMLDLKKEQERRPDTASL
jgi:hypothetical protein